MSKQKEEQVYKTKYDKKMAERKLQKKKDAQSLLAARIVGVAILVVVLAAIIIPITVSIVKKNEALRELDQTYVKINDHEITKLEYDYYYNTMVNNYMNTYGSFLQYMGLDTTQDFSLQQYSDEMTWKDYFDKMTVEQIKQTYAMLDDAQANGFSYDVTQEYDSYLTSVKEAADTNGSNVKDYYKAYFGTYATETNVADYIKDGILVSAYYDQLIKDHEPTEEEVQNYYQEAKNSYDQIDYKSYVSSSELAEDATEEEKSADLEKRLADATEQLVLAENGEESALELELIEGAQYATVPTAASEWLFDEARAEGDMEVFSDESTSTVYVVEFVKRYYDEANNETISQLLAQQTVTEYAYSLAEEYTVTDIKGDLKYLTIPETTTETEE